jgi:glycosyltransferase involved in cell wall biosynthesis/SAM-dependent methyltransferase
MGVASPLRILMVSDVSPVHIKGGAERVLWEQASRLAKRGHQVRILSRSARDTTSDTIERQGVRIHQFSADRGSLLRFPVSSIRRAGHAVDRALAEEPADVLQLYQPFSGFGALHSDRAKGLPCLYTFLSPAPLEYLSRRGMTGHHRPGLVGRAAQILLWGIERACLRRASRIHVLSEFSASQLWRLYRIPSERVVKIPGGADIDRFRPAADRSAVRSVLGVPERRPLLFTVRNLEARMGLDTLIRATSILRQHIPAILLLVGGAGSLRGSLESLTTSLDLQDHVRFLGYVAEDDLPLYYQAADVFVLPTRELEGFGLITVEALASGTPVMGTAIGATPEILLPLDPSLVFEDTTPEAMARNLRQLFERSRCEKDAVSPLREACRLHAEKNYNWDRSVATLEEVLAHLARSPAGAPPVSLSCPACGGSTWKRDLVYLGATYFSCSGCGAGVASTLPTSASLRYHYEVDYPRRFHHEQVGEPRADLFTSILGHLHTLRAGGRLLDVGCGGGHLLASAALRGWSSLGTDLSHRACAIAQRAGTPVVQAEGSALPLRDACVEAVSLINVLDHTLDPLETLREAARVLVPGGHLVIRAPNATFHRSWVRLLTSLSPLPRWYGWDGYPVLHVFAFPGKSLRSLATRAGFEVLTVRNSSLAAEDAPWPRGWWRGAVRRSLHGAILATSTGLAFLSRGHWLVGPSIELYAQRPQSADRGQA